ncbi:MAG TPA: VOC family protein [Solirubrobacter sp.]|nr:VOC family protein [Solirubrobacter sp.]
MLQHVALEVPPDAVDDCVAFWALLGFERAAKPPRLQTSSVWVARDGTQIHLLPTDEPAVAPKGHVAVVAPDYERVLLALSEAGYRVSEELNAWGAPRCSVRDPAGHKIEVMAAPPP